MKFVFIFQTQQIVIQCGEPILTIVFIILNFRLSRLYTAFPVGISDTHEANDKGCSQNSRENGLTEKPTHFSYKHEYATG